MATASVTNDLQTPIEVAVQGDWRVLYPQKSCDVGVLEASAFSTSSGPEFKGEALIQVRLRESPEVRGSCLAAGGASLQASVDFGAFSQRCKGRDRAEARELAREGARRKEAQERMDIMIKEAATKKRNEEAWHTLKCTGSPIAILLALLLVCAAIPPESELAAALLASATVPLCWFISCIGMCTVSTAGDDLRAFNFGKYALFFRLGFLFACLLALLALVYMSALHALQRYVHSSVLVAAGAAVGGFLLCLFSWDRTGLNENDKKVLKRERKEALCEIRNRTIRFEGSVIIWPRGRPCVASWPGKYAGAWESLVSQSRDGQVSAAVVFLPEGTDDYGKCDSIPEAEGLPGSCWCTPLYGEQKPWGCRWFTKWKENIEVAVASGAQLEVYFFQSQVGQGKVESFESAGEDNLRREKINHKQKEFEESLQFQQALAAGVGNLSKEPRGDGSSQYSREVRRLFLVSLPETEREFITASEGLGNSQKAEVAWLEKKGYEYWGVDVATWLPGEGAEICFSASSRKNPRVDGRQDDFPSICVPIGPPC